MLEVASNSSAALPHQAVNHFTRTDMLGYASVATLAVATLAVAYKLTPSSNGFGTHQQLGLPPCMFLHWTGFPCPSCGLTTCFAHAAHGQFIAAFVAQPFGLLLFLLTLLAMPFALYCLRRRIPWSSVVHARMTNRAMRAMLVLYLLSWGYKIYAMRGWA